MIAVIFLYVDNVTVMYFEDCLPPFFHEFAVHNTHTHTHTHSFIFVEKISHTEIYKGIVTKFLFLNKKPISLINFKIILNTPHYSNVFSNRNFYVLRNKCLQAVLLFIVWSPKIMSLTQFFLC